MTATQTLDHATALASVLRLLRTEFPALRRIELGPDTPLLSSGLLDSFATVTLLAALDGAFGTDIDVEQVELDQLETPSRIAELCLRAPGQRQRSRSGV